MNTELCAGMGPQGNEPHCPCVMKRLGLPTSAGNWTEQDIDDLKNAIGSIFNSGEIDHHDT